MIETVLELVGEINIGGVASVDVTVKEHYAEGSTLFIVLSNNQILTIDLSPYMDSDLTEELIEAINSMSCDIDENGNLQMNYNDSILAINFEIEDGDLIAESNVEGLSFNINSNGEMEAIY